MAWLAKNKSEAGPLVRSIQAAIKKLISIIGATLCNASRSDQHALEKLLQDAEYIALHLCSHAIVSDTLNPDELIAEDELAPSL